MKFPFLWSHRIPPRVLIVTAAVALSGCGYENNGADTDGLSTINSANCCKEPAPAPDKLATLNPATALPHKTGDPPVPARLQGAVTGNALNLCEGLVTHTDGVAVKKVAKPPYMKPYRDPAFGTTVMRISNSQPDEVHKPAYSTVQAWNADESLLMLYRNNGGQSNHILLDGHTYEPVRKLNIIPADLEEVFWSHTDPDIFYYVSKYARDFGQFKRYKVSKGKADVIAEFSDYCGLKGLPVSGHGVHMQAWDDDLFGFRCRKSKDEWVMLTYRISTDEIVSVPLGEGTPWNQWSAPIAAPSGNRLWFQGRSLKPDLTTVEHRLDMHKSNEHANVGKTHTGADALFQVAFEPSPGRCNGDKDRGVGHLLVHNMETGECRSVINEAKGYPYPTSGTHLSAQAYHQPGWVALSSIGYDQFEWFTNGQNAPPLFSEIYLANTDPDNAVVCRLAQHRSFSKHAKNGSYKPYFGEPHATISPSGTRILFGSDWYDSGSVDTYVIELPAYQRQ